MPQLVKKVRSDFFDKLTQSSTTVWRCCFACCSKEEDCMRIGGWSDYKVMHEIYAHLAARDLNARVREMENFYKENL